MDKLSALVVVHGFALEMARQFDARKEAKLDIAPEEVESLKANARIAREAAHVVADVIAEEIRKKP